MKNSKKVVLLLVAVMLVSAMCLAFAACGEKPTSSYTVSFIADGQPYKTLTSNGASVTLPAAPTKTGYDFAGWYLDNETFQQAFNANNITNDVVVYAKFSKKAADVTTNELSDQDMSSETYAAEAGAVIEVAAYASQYITNGAIDNVDNTKNIQAAIKKQIATSKVVKSVDVALVDGQYELTFTFVAKDNVVNTYTYTDATLTAKAINAGNYAGYAIQKGTAAKFDASFAKVYNAAIKTINEAIDDGSAFGEAYVDKKGNVVFGLSAHALFEFSYGDMETPVTYGLLAEGTLGRYAKDTNAKIEVIDESTGKAVVGLYYIGAEAEADCKVYLSLEFGEYKQDIFMDNADINALIANVLDDYFDGAIEREHGCEEHVDADKDSHCDACGKYMCYHVDKDPDDKDDVADCKCYKCGASMHIDADKDNKCDVCKKVMNILAKSNYTSFGTALNDLGLGSTGALVSSLLNSLVTASEGKVGDATRYQYSLDIEKTIEGLLNNKSIADAAAGVVSNLTANVEFLKGFDLASFKGVGGTLLITADVNKDGLLCGFQLSYNVAEKDFRWSKNDSLPKVYGPVNVAITAKDVVVSGDALDEIETKEGSTYAEFNPLAGEIAADITITTKQGDDAAVTTEYALEARADYNAFALALAGIKDDAKDLAVDGQAEIVVRRKADNSTYLHIYFHDLTFTKGKDQAADVWASTVEVLWDGKYYTTKTDNSVLPLMLGVNVLGNLMSEDNVSIITPIQAYVEELIEQFSNEEEKVYTEAEFNDYKADILNKIDALKAGDGTTSTFLDGIKNTAKDQVNAIAFNQQSAASDFVKMLNIYEKAKSDFKEQEAWEGRTGVGAFDGFDLMALISNFGKIKDFFTEGKIQIKDEKGQVIETKTFYELTVGGVNIWDADFDDEDADFTPALMVNLDADVYNAVMDLLRPALPNLPTFTEDAATVVVHMNDSEDMKSKLYSVVEYEDVKVEVEGSLVEFYAQDGKIDPNGKITGKVTVTYKEDVYVFDLTIELKNWLKADGSINFVDGGMVGTLSVDMDGNQYKYELSLALNNWNWDAKSGSATVVFKEGDAATMTEGVIEYQTFVTATLTIKENAFDLALALASRNVETNDLNPVHNYVISGEADPDNSKVSMTIRALDGEKTVVGLTLGGKSNGINENGYLPLGLPDPSVGFSVGIDFNGNSCLVDVDNLTIVSWTKAVTVKGFDANEIDEECKVQGFDFPLQDKILEMIQPYLWEVVEE